MQILHLESLYYFSIQIGKMSFLALKLIKTLHLESFYHLLYRDVYSDNFGNLTQGLIIETNENKCPNTICRVHKGNLISYFNFYFCLSIHVCFRFSFCPKTRSKSHGKMSLTKVAWPVLRMKNMHS